MNVSGRRTITCEPCQTCRVRSPCNLRWALNSSRCSRSMASRNQNPALCRVLSYFGPGLPRPAISQQSAMKRACLVSVFRLGIVLAVLVGNLAIAVFIGFRLGNRLDLSSFTHGGVGFGRSLTGTLRGTNEDGCHYRMIGVLVDLERGNGHAFR